MCPVMNPLPGHDYDFQLSVRPDGGPGFVERESLEAFLLGLPGVRRHEVAGFVLDAPLGRWMEITPQCLSPESGPVPADRGDRVNLIHVRFPANARSPELDRDYIRTAFHIADHLGWRVRDDTDSGDWISEELVEAWWPMQRRKPWWKIW